MSNQPEPNEQQSAEQDSGPVRLKSPQALERLRDRVQTAARELARLRQENAKLAERIRTLETRPVVDPDAALVTFDEDPEELRRKVEGFIDAIDQYLSNEPEPVAEDDED